MNSPTPTSLPQYFWGSGYGGCLALNWSYQSQQTQKRLEELSKKWRSRTCDFLKGTNLHSDPADHHPITPFWYCRPHMSLPCCNRKRKSQRLSLPATASATNPPSWAHLPPKRLSLLILHPQRKLHKACPHSCAHIRATELAVFLLRARYTGIVILTYLHIWYHSSCHF